MNTVSIQYAGPALLGFPALGQGLWVDRLNDGAEALEIIDWLQSAHLELLVDLRNDGAFDRLEQALRVCASSETDIWLLVVVDDAQPHAQLRQLAGLINERFVIRGVLVTPAAYLESYQPDGIWPCGMTPVEVAQLAREYVPQVMIGAGVPTFFTELNRCRPTPGSFDYLTHATSPIVHAADDASIVESLQALPDVFRSGRALADGKPYRLTTSAVGAWRNPYGGQLTPNPQRERLTLSDQDPRQRGLLAAVWTLAHYHAAQCSGVDAIALWAVNEPFSVASAQHYWPVFHVIKGLSLARGRSALVFETSSPDIVALGWSEDGGENVRLWLGNLSCELQTFEIIGAEVTGCTVLDQDSYVTALSDPQFMQPVRESPVSTLKAWAVAVIDCRLTVEPAL